MRGLVKFVPAVAYHFCPSLPEQRNFLSSVEEGDFSKPMAHAIIMGQCIYPFEALDDDYGSKLH